MLEKRSSGSNTKYNSSLHGTTSMGQSKTKDNFSVSMVSTRVVPRTRREKVLKTNRWSPQLKSI